MFKGCVEGTSVLSNAVEKMGNRLKLHLELCVEEMGKL